MIKKQELADKVKELEGTLRVSEDQVDRFIGIRDTLVKEKQKLDESIQSLEQ